MTPDPEPDNTPVIIGVGNTGCQLAASCDTDRIERRFVDFDPDTLVPYEPDEILELPGQPDPAAPHSADRAIADALAALAASLDGGRLVLLTGGVGRLTGATVLPLLARELKAVRCTNLVVALQPLPFEGALRAETAARTLEELSHLADLILTIPNRPLADLCDPALPVRKALSTLRTRATEAVAHLLDALTHGAAVGIQPSELRQILTDAGRGAFGVGSAAGERRVEDALRDACANSFLTQESCQRAARAILHLRGGRDLSLQEIYGAADLVAQIVGHDAVQAALSTTADDDDRVSALLLVTGIRSPEEEAVLNGHHPDALAEHHDLSLYDGVNLDVPAYLRRRGHFRIRH